MFDELEKHVKNTPGGLPEIPLSVAQMIKDADELSIDQKRQAFDLIRDWTEYAKENNVTTDDLYGLRAHLESFAQRFELSQNKEAGKIEKVELPLSTIHLPDGRPISEIVQGLTSPEIFADSRIIVYGGAARAVMRAHLLEQGKGSLNDLQNEIPISDVDMMIIGADNAEAVAQKYQSELGGTKVVIDKDQEIDTYLRTVDVTMNQALIHNGTLIATKQALDDAANGVIRSLGSEKALFQPDSLRMQSGEGYLLRSGFYRNLAVLLRGRGQKIIVSKENLEAEKDKIGRYWLVLLFVKLLPMKNEQARTEAVLQWHQVAKDIGSTQAQTPVDFLNELQAKFPDFDYRKKDNVFAAEDQARWLIGKLARRGLRTIIDDPTATPPLPTTYTPADITLRTYEGSRNLESFWSAVEKYRSKK